MNTARQNLGWFCSLLLAVTASAPLGVARAQPQRRGLPAPKQSLIPSEPVGVPMHRFNRLPAIDVTINGRGPFRLIVDTGAAGLILKSELADELKLPAPPGLPPGAAEVQLRSPGGPVRGTLGYVKSLEVGGAAFRGIWTVGIEMPFGDDLDGVLGMNVFNECLLTYDYPGHRIELSRGELPEVNGRDILSFSTPASPGSHPIIELKVGGKATSFMIDTGMRGWFAMPAEEVKKLDILEGPVAGMRGLSAGGPGSDRQMARLGATIALGQYTVKDPLVSFGVKDGGVRLGVGRVLGALLLEHFVVTFDARNNRVRFKRESTASIIPPSVRMVGLGLRRKGKSMEVWAVHSDSHASSLGIAEGSLVHEINGKPAVKLYGTSEWHALLRSADSVELTYSPKGSESARTVDVQILELLPGVDEKRRRPTTGGSHEFSPELLQRGAAAYQTGMCAKCHGENGAGSKRAPDLTDDQWLHADGSIESIRAIIVSGVPRKKLKDPDRPYAMNPATNLITDEKAIDALAVYVASLRRK